MTSKRKTMTKQEARERAAKKVWPSGYYFYGRFVSAAPGSQFVGLPTPGDALAEARRSRRSVRDFTGGLNHPCGCGVGRSLMGEVPHGPCRKHGKED